MQMETGVSPLPEFLMKVLCSAKAQSLPQDVADFQVTI